MCAPHPDLPPVGGQEEDPASQGCPTVVWANLVAFLQGVSAKAEYRVGIDLDVDDGRFAVPHGLVHRLGGVPRLGRQVAIALAF